MQEPLLSVVVPVYNGKRYIRDTLDSLTRLEEALPCEVIFQNSCSTDGTTEILDNFCRGRQNRHHFNEQDNGQSAAINTGMARARGRWVTWLCADDLILPEVARALAEGERAGAEVVYGDVIFIQGPHAFPAEGTEAYAPGVLAKRRLVIQQPGTCILRETWNELGGVTPSRNWAMDYDLFLRLESAGRSFYRASSFIAVIRVHADAKTSSGSFKRLQELWSILWQSHCRRPPYFRLRPYVVYGTEFVIKFFEARLATGNRFPPRAALALLHKFFWIAARAGEKTPIRQRFQTIPREVQMLLAGLTKKQ
jgi:glycosyltransferase involved in cell wall biosynthesis